ISSLLCLSRISRGDLSLATVDLSAMARVIAAELQLVQPERQAVFTIADGGTAYGDAELLRLVMTNIIGNAWKYTGKKETTVIDFGMTECEGERAYFIRDNGTGFDMNQADKLFTAFERLHKKNDFEGHGIGLATVQRIIHRHGGRVWAEGEVDKGATFYFVLPT
ncbi:MAG TPA: ATP-binding protein, partial [Geobacteraceae bacterium]|nr:ATP-binding protein [Geobacteraceae bacterium]